MAQTVSIDTNVLVRFLVSDGEAVEQCQAAKQLFREHTVFLTESVLLEAEWVLRTVYSIARSDLCEAFQKLLRLKQVSLSEKTLVLRVLEYYEEGFDFADALHLLRSQGHEMKTFDQAFSKKAWKHGFAVSAP